MWKECNARIFEKVGTGCDRAGACERGWGSGTRKCCSAFSRDGLCKAAQGVSGTGPYDFVAKYSHELHSVGRCTGGDYIRVEAGCGIEVYKHDSNENPQSAGVFKGDAPICSATGVGCDQVRFIRLFHIFLVIN